MYGRGEDVVRLRFRSVSRDTLGFGCVRVHICSHHHTFVQARALALTYLQSGVECPNFFIFASLSLNTVVCVGVRVDVFLFFVCQVSKAFLYFQKGQNTRFRVQSHSRTRALWTTTTTTRFGRRRRHMASSSSSRVVVVVVFCADGANCRSLEIERSEYLWSRDWRSNQGCRLRISKIMHQKKKYLKKNEKHSLKKLDDVFSFGFTT